MEMRPRTGKNLSNHLGKALSFILVAAQFFLSTPTYAEDIEAIYSKLKKELPKKEMEWEKKFNLTEKFINYLNEAEKALTQLDLSVEVGFKGHRADEAHLYDINAETKITKGIYPREFRLKAGTSVQLKNNDFTEEVTSLMVNYDYHFNSWLEAYGFAERFSDSYLSIKHRYEIGGGIKFEFNLGTTMKIDEKWDKNLKTYKVIYNEACDGYKNYLESLDKNSTDKKSMTNTNLLSNQLDELDERRKDIERAFKKKYAKLSAGMAFSIFSELEKAEIEKIFEDESIPEDKEPFSLDGEQRFRIALRPSVVYRPTDNLTLIWLKYYKHATDDWRDYRTDELIRAELKLPVIPNWPKNVLLVFEYKRHYDKVPPQSAGFSF